MTAAARGQEVRQQLLRAAVELIPELGWTAVSTRILAERAGVTPSVVHYHFRSMSALLGDAVVHRMQEMLDDVEVFFDRAHSPADAVDAMLSSVREYSGSDRTSLLFIEAYLAATRDECLRDQIGLVVHAFQQRLGHWFAERGVSDADATAAVFIATIDGLLVHRGLGTDPSAEATSAVLRRLVAEGTTSNSAQRKRPS